MKQIVGNIKDSGLINYSYTKLIQNKQEIELNLKKQLNFASKYMNTLLNNNLSTKKRNLQA